MQTPPNKKNTGDLLALILIVGGVLYICVLLLFMKEGVFFSGDAGVKYLMTKQVAEGGSATNFSIQKPGWVRSVWDMGFFPLKKPFVYPIDKQMIYAFPPAFEYISAPFFKWAGFRGLFLVPALALVSLWFACWQLFKHACKDLSIRLLALILLIFGSPLTSYGALFWEHTIAAALTFAGCRFFVRMPKAILPSLILGIIAGSAIFFRIETGILSVLFSMAAFYHWFLNRSGNVLAFITGLTISTIALVGFNRSVYGTALGAQGLQFISGSETDMYKPSVLTILFHINLRLIEYFPVVIIIFLTWFRIWKGNSFQPRVYQLTYIITCFLVIVPFFVPNAGGKQVGPRYLLPIIAPLVVLVSILLRRPVKIPYFNFLLPILLGWCFTINLFFSGGQMYSDYNNRIFPLYERINSSQTEVVIVQNQYIVQELATLFDRKHFFVAENAAEYSRLYYELKSKGVKRVIYASVANDRPSLEKTGGYYFSETELP